MKKATVVKLCIVLGICLTCFISYQSDVIRRNKLNNMLNETYDNAIQAGGEMLKKEFPDVINDDSDFIGYELNGVWHVQNYVNGSTGGYMGYDRTLADIDSIRYVKFKDENFDEILTFGRLESHYKEMDSKFEITDFESVHLVLEQISSYKLDNFINNAYYTTNYDKRAYANMHEVIEECYRITMRDSDGLIYYFGMICG